MALDLRLQQKMAQQLVMTPQLQQAIKLLQLSHLEMAEVLREEIEQNPVLEERGEHGEDAQPGDSDYDAEPAEMGLTPDAGGGDVPEGGDAGGPEAAPPGEIELATDLNSASEAPVDATPEPTGS